MSWGDDKRRVLPRAKTQKVLADCVGGVLGINKYGREWYAFTEWWLAPLWRVEHVLQWWNIKPKRMMVQITAGGRLVVPSAQVAPPPPIDHLVVEGRKAKEPAPLEMNGKYLVHRYHPEAGGQAVTMEGDEPDTVLAFRTNVIWMLTYPSTPSATGTTYRLTDHSRIAVYHDDQFAGLLAGARIRKVERERKGA